MHFHFTKNYLLLQVLSILLFSCAQNVPGKNKETIKASVIIKMLNKEQAIEIDNKIISGDIDFSLVESKATIHSMLSQSVINSTVSFTNCQFEGKVMCSGKAGNITYQSVFKQNLIFNTCEFNDVADFQSVTAYGNVSFSGSLFKAIALFNSFYSHAKASYFGQITAEKEFAMQDACFLGSCDFAKSHFIGNVSFQGSRFDGVFTYNTVTCDARADFSKVRFNNNCTFNYAAFNGVTRFNQLRCLGIADFIQVKFNSYAVFTNALFYDRCKFNESKIAALFDFTSCVFYFGEPAFDKIEIANPSQYKTGKVLEQNDFILPKINE